MLSVGLIVPHAIRSPLATARSAVPIVVARRWTSIRARITLLSNIAAIIVLVLVAYLEHVLFPPAVLLRDSPAAAHALHARARPEIATSETRVVLPQPGIAAQAPLADRLEAAWGAVRRRIVDQRRRASEAERHYGVVNVGRGWIRGRSYLDYRVPG